MSLITVIHRIPGLPAEAVCIDNTLDEMQRLVGGELLRVRLNGDMHVWVDAYGITKKLPGNFVRLLLGPTGPKAQRFVGPVVISRVDAQGCEIGFPCILDALSACRRVNAGLLG